MKPARQRQRPFLHLAPRQHRLNLSHAWPGVLQMAPTGPGSPMNSVEMAPAIRAAISRRGRPAVSRRVTASNDRASIGINPFLATRDVATRGCRLAELLALPGMARQRPQPPESVRVVWVVAAAFLANLTWHAVDVAFAAVVVVAVEVEALAVAAGLARGAGIAASPTVILVR
jgi:hypothetical protein